ncbi:hypothetical protein AB9P05_13335 [Roseivirga sp. BDSF3-8]|uniref:hypothetical protein n=1 Tax=Roseivirga sp. BDSF3-8 TaxID=3241598 RepID=UPI003531D598
MSAAWRFYSFDVDRFEKEVANPDKGPDLLRQHLETVAANGEEHLSAAQLQHLKGARLDYKQLEQKEWKWLDLYYHRAIDTGGEVPGVIPAEEESYEFAHNNVWAELEGLIGINRGGKAVVEALLNMGRRHGYTPVKRSFFARLFGGGTAGYCDYMITYGEELKEFVAGLDNAFRAEVYNLPEEDFGSKEEIKKDFYDPFARALAARRGIVGTFG